MEVSSLKKQCKYINIKRLPTDEEWLLANEAVWKEVYKKRGKDPLLEVDKKVDLHDILDGVFFLLYKLDVKKIRRIKEICYFFKNHFNTNKDLKAFEDNWYNKGEDYSFGEEYFFSLSMEAMCYMIRRDRQNIKDYILYLGCTDNIASNYWKSVEYRMMHFSLPKFKLKENQKYLPAIFNVAKDLVEWMYKNN